MCEPGEEDRERDMRGGDFDSVDDSDEARMLGRTSRISGARDRFVVGTLTNVDTDACEQGLRCSDQGMCTRVTGEERTEKREGGVTLEVSVYRCSSGAQWYIFPRLIPRLLHHRMRLRPQVHIYSSPTTTAMFAFQDGGAWEQAYSL